MLDSSRENNTNATETTLPNKVEPKFYSQRAGGRQQNLMYEHRISLDRLEKKPVNEAVPNIGSRNNFERGHGK